MIPSNSTVTTSFPHRSGVWIVQLFLTPADQKPDQAKADAQRPCKILLSAMRMPGRQGAAESRSFSARINASCLFFLPSIQHFVISGD